jgi:hypothetical protein
VKLIYSLLILFFIFYPLYAENYGSISGKVTGEKSGEGIPGVVVEVVTINSVIDIKTKTDSEGRYSFDKLSPDTYYLNFFPGHPYCVKNEWDIHKVRVEAGKKVVLNKILKLGGAVTGKVYKSDGKTPFEKAYVHVFFSDGSSKSTRTIADGSYFVGDLCPSNNYVVRIYFGIPGQASRRLTGIMVSKGKVTKIKDIVLNLNDVTGIEGYVTSSCDGGPFENAECSISKEVDALNNKNIPIGDISTDKNGYYRMKGMEPGTYWVWICPPLPPKKDVVTGKPFFSMQSYGRYFTWGKTVVEKGRVTRMDMKLNIPSYSKTMKTQVDVRLIYGKDLDKQPYRIIFEASGSGQGMLPYIKKKIIKDQFNYRFVGISPGRYWFGLSFLENTNGGENEKIYSNITSSWREIDRRIFVPWDYKVIIDVLIPGNEIDLKKKSKKSRKSDVTTSVDLVEILKKRKERTFYYKFEVTRKMNKK